MGMVIQRIKILRFKVGYASWFVSRLDALNIPTFLTMGEVSWHTMAGEVPCLTLQGPRHTCSCFGIPFCLSSMAWHKKQASIGHWRCTATGYRLNS